MELLTHAAGQPSSTSRIVRTMGDLVAFFEQSQQPRGNWRIGTETEKFGVVGGRPDALPYIGPVSVIAVMSKLATRFGWAPESESPGAPVIALKRGLSSITLEPGGQLELSGAPLPDVHATCAEMEHHVREIELVSIPLGISWLSIGFHPFARREDLPMIPKARYGIMREYLPLHGDGALDMMQRTATVQANLDYEDERDAMRKMQVFLKLAPIVHAMTAHAPLAESRLTPFQSLRGDVWLRMDKSRSGLLEGFWRNPKPSYETYVNWALDSGMFLFKRGGHVIANTGQTFRSFMEDGFEGHRATFEDWVLHLNTLFPEIRLKKTIEVRCCDAQPLDTLLAVPALWTGIGYDDTALEQAARLTHDLNYDAVSAARPDLAKLGLSSNIAGKSTRALSEAVLSIANDGLQRRARRNAAGIDERRFLAPLIRLNQLGLTPADRLRRKLQRTPIPDAQSIIESTRMIPDFYA
jgi:glutamate--cysteine ligase